MKNTTHLFASNQRIVVKFLILIGILCHTSLGLSDVYKTVDEKGKVTFTDKPTPDAETVDIKETNLATPVQVPARERQEGEPSQDDYKSLTITSHSNDDIIPNGLNPFNVSTQVNPSLQQGHKLRLYIDGQKYSEGTASNFRVTSIARGSHTLQVTIVDQEGNSLKQSEAVTIFAYRPGG